MSSQAYSVVVADRRLTQADGSVKSDEQTKLSLVTFNDGRFAVGFSGLAEYGSGLRTQEWILDALLRAGAPDFSVRNAIPRFHDELEQRWRTVKASASARRLSVVFSGFTYDEGFPRAAGLKITNWEGDNVYYDEAFEPFSFSATQERVPKTADEGMAS